MTRVQRRTHRIQRSPSAHIIDLRQGDGTPQVIPPRMQPTSPERVRRLFFLARLAMWMRRRGWQGRRAHGEVSAPPVVAFCMRPRVDLAHGLVFSDAEIPIADDGVPHRDDHDAWPQSRVSRAWRDLAFVDLIRLCGGGVFARAIHTRGLQPCVRVVRRMGVSLAPLFPVTAVVRVGVARHILIFLLVAGALAAPFGLLGAAESIVTFGHHAQQTAALVRTTVSAMIVAAERGAWQDVGVNAERLFTHFRTLEGAVEKVPSVLRGFFTSIPGIGTTIASGLDIVHDSAQMSDDVRVVSSILARASGVMTPALFHDVASPLSRIMERAARLTDAVRTVASGPVASYLPFESTRTRDAARTWGPSLRDGAHLIALADAVAGFDRPRRYLVVFQNPHELRATGGFLGSYGVVEITQGAVRSWRIPSEGSYGVHAALDTRVAPPRPLQLITSEWGMHDANWWPDWPVTAEKILWFWERAGGPPVDGVLAVNGTMLEETLRVLGPLTLADEPLLTAENALATIERAIERERGEDNRRQPKRILGVLADALAARLQGASMSDRVAVFRAGLLGFARRELLLYARDPEIAAHVQALGWDGRNIPRARDTLMVVQSNIGGGKTDAVMDDTLTHSVFIQPDGTAVVTVTLDRAHRGVRGNRRTGVQNIDYVRFYTPPGSRFIDAWGFSPMSENQFEAPSTAVAVDGTLQERERAWRQDPRTGTDIYTEDQSTVFGHWILTRPGTQSSAGIRYVLPFRLQGDTGAAGGGLAQLIRRIQRTPTFIPYDVAIVRQPGTRMRVTSTITAPAVWETTWRYPLTSAVTPATVSYTGTLDNDLWLGVVWKQ